MRRYGRRKKATMSETAAKYPVLFAVIGIAFLVFAIFLSVGIFVRSNEINRAVDKNVTVNGTVTRVWTTKSRRKISKHNYKTVITYHASVGYEYNGRKYTNSDLSFGSKTVLTGEIVRLYIDPDNPSVSYRGRSDFLSLPNILTCMIPLFMGMSFIISLFIGLKKRKKMRMMPTFTGNGTLPGQTYNNNSGFGGNYINNPNADYQNNSYNNNNYNNTNNYNNSYNNSNSYNNNNYNTNSYNNNGYNNTNGYNYGNSYNNLNTPYGNSSIPPASGSGTSDDSWDFLNH